MNKNAYSVNSINCTYRMAAYKFIVNANKIVSYFLLPVTCNLQQHFKYNIYRL